MKQRATPAYAGAYAPNGQGIYLFSFDPASLAVKPSKGAPCAHSC